MKVEEIKTESPLSGKVKWFNDLKGFGFIEHSSGKDVFVHFSVIEAGGFKSLKEGEEVEYELDIRDRGYFATKVKRVAGDSLNKPETAILTVDEDIILKNNPLQNAR